MARCKSATNHTTFIDIAPAYGVLHKKNTKTGPQMLHLLDRLIILPYFQSICVRNRAKRVEKHYQLPKNNFSIRFCVFIPMLFLNVAKSIFALIFARINATDAELPADSAAYSKISSIKIYPMQKHQNQHVLTA
jgi:hypothetical protein